MRIVDVTKLHALIQETSSVLAHDTKNHVLSAMSHSLFCKINKEGYLNSGTMQSLYHKLPQDGVYFNLDVSEGFKKWYPSMAHEIAKRLTANTEPEITATILAELIKNENWVKTIRQSFKDHAKHLSTTNAPDYIKVLNRYCDLHERSKSNLTSNAIQQQEHDDFLSLCKETKQSCNFLVPPLLNKLKDLMDLAEEISLLSNPEKVASVAPLSQGVIVTTKEDKSQNSPTLPEPVSSLKLKRG